MVWTAEPFYRPMQEQFFAMPHRLTDQQAIEVLEDFKSWSGGLCPAQVEREQVLAFIDTRMTAKLYGKARESMVEAILELNTHA